MPASYKFTYKKASVTPLKVTTSHTFNFMIEALVPPLTVTQLLVPSRQCENPKLILALRIGYTISFGNKLRKIIYSLDNRRTRMPS